MVGTDNDTSDSGDIRASEREQQTLKIAIPPSEVARAEQGAISPMSQLVVCPLFVGRHQKRLTCNGKKEGG